MEKFIKQIKENQTKSNMFLLGIIALIIIILLMNLYFQTEKQNSDRIESGTLEAGIKIILSASESIENENKALKRIISNYENGIDFIFYSYQKDNLELTYYQKMDDIAERVNTINFFEERRNEN